MTLTDAELLRQAADHLGTGPASLATEYPDVDACTADLMRKHATLLDHGGTSTDTPRLLAMARQILAEAS